MIFKVSVSLHSCFEHKYLHFLQLKDLRSKEGSGLSVTCTKYTIKMFLAHYILQYILFVYIFSSGPMGLDKTRHYKPTSDVSPTSNQAQTESGNIFFCIQYFVLILNVNPWHWGFKHVKCSMIKYCQTFKIPNTKDTGELKKYLKNKWTTVYSKYWHTNHAFIIYITYAFYRQIT